ncbi:unnamed protein product [Sympodiomycopsis kandeliae]
MSDSDVEMSDAGSGTSTPPVPRTYEDVQELRSQGNDLFKAKKYGSALDKYTEAIDVESEIRIAGLKQKAAAQQQQQQQQSNGVNGFSSSSLPSSSSSSSSTNTNSDGSLYLNRAAAYMAINKHADAVKDCRQAVSIQEENLGAATIKAQLRFCRALIGCGQFSEARSRLDALLSSPATKGDERTQLETLSNQFKTLEGHWDALNRDLSAKEYRMASFAIDKLLASALVPCPPPAWRIISITLLFLRNDSSLQMASGRATDLLRLDQSNSEALLLRARIFFAQGDLAKAIQHCQAALRNDPDLTSARDLMRFGRRIEKIKDEGNSAAKAGRWVGAKDKYTEGLSELGVQSSQQQAQTNGDSPNGSVDVTSSASALFAGIETTEGGSRLLRATLFSNRATANLKTKSYDDALSDCNSTLALSPSYLKAIRTRARVHLALDNFEDSIKDFKEAIENVSPSDSDAESTTRALKKELQEAEMLHRRSLRKDHYKTLGIKRDAEESEIKKAYRVASLRHHPDKGGDEAKFKEIGEAYNILSDPQKRRRYDAGADDPESESPFAGGGGMGGMGGGVDLSDLFGGGGGMGGGFPGGGMGGFPGGMGGMGGGMGGFPGGMGGGGMGGGGGFPGAGGSRRGGGGHPFFQ